MPDIERDLQMMQSPSMWPRWPLLPLACRTGHMSDAAHCAFLFSDGRPVIYIGIIFMMPSAEGQTWADVLRSFEHKEYASFEALASEYRVD